MYVNNFHIIHTPTPPTHSHSGIIVLISKEYDILQQNILKRGWIMKNGKKHKLSMKEQANMKDGIKQLQEKLYRDRRLWLLNCFSIIKKKKK